MQDINKGKEICSFLQKKLALFSQYLSITKRMKEALNDKETSNIGASISERQDCINKIERIDASIERIVKEGSGKGDGGGEGLIDSYMSRIKSIMETIDLMDKELTVMVKEESETIKTELLNIRNVRHAARGYKKIERFSPRFLDTVR